METKNSIGGARRRPGRKPLVEGFTTSPVSIKMTGPQHEKFKRLGGSKWVREKIEQARETTNK